VRRKRWWRGSRWSINLNKRYDDNDDDDNEEALLIASGKN
jgi:hypothetical protein